MKHYILLFFTIALLLNSCKKDDDNNAELDLKLSEQLSQISNGVGEEAFVLPEANDFSKIPQDPLNPLTAEKVELGKLLFHETGIGLAPMQEFSKGTFSCATCHFAGAGFQAGRFQGIGDGGIGFGINGEGRTRGALYEGEQLDVQPIRVPTAMNGAYQINMMWNGQFGATGINIGTESAWTIGTPKENNFLGFEGLETQALAGLTEHRMIMDSTFIHGTAYKGMFDAAFPNTIANERYSLLNAALAIAAYERTVLSNQAPFQQWLKGNKNTLTELEKRGAILFFGEAGCANCHNSPALNSMEFHAVGLNDLVDCPEETFKTTPDNPQNLGRGGFTGKAEDNYKFKVPQLYNLRDSPFYGHGASIRSVQAMVEYFNNGIAENSDVPNGQLADEFQPLNLSNEEVNQITAFLENALYDGNLKRYEPSSLPTGNCFPNNDPLSRNELGCD